MITSVVYTAAAEHYFFLFSIPYSTTCALWNVAFSYRYEYFTRTVSNSNLTDSHSEQSAVSVVFVRSTNGFQSIKTILLCAHLLTTRLLCPVDGVWCISALLIGRLIVETDACFFAVTSSWFVWHPFYCWPLSAPPTSCRTLPKTTMLHRAANARRYVVASFCLLLTPPCWRYITAQQCSVVKLRMFANCCCMWNHTSLNARYDIKKLSDFRILTTLFVHIKCTSNMTAWFYVQFIHVSAPRVYSITVYGIIKKVVYREPVDGPRSRGIVNRHPAINNKLATKPTPKPNTNSTLTVP